MKSIPYYNNNPEKFIEDTYFADMSKHYDNFESHMTKKGFLLDLGCGSGRDSAYFNSKGYSVVSMDGSEEMVKHFKATLDTPVFHSTFFKE